MEATLYPYQEYGVKWMLFNENQKSGPKGGFLCDEMGLGKTIQTLGVILGNRKKNTLIIVPKSLVNQWFTEIQCFAPTLKVLKYDGLNRTRDSNDFLKHDIVLCPYSLLSDKKSLIQSVSWDRVVLDEAHEIRNKQTSAHKNARNLQTSIRWLLTGTPVFNSMSDFVNLCAFFGIPKHVVQSNHKQIQDTYILRRTKKDVKIEIPRCHIENVELDMNEDERALYDQVYSESAESITHIMRSQLGQEQKNMHVLECLLRVRQVMIWPNMYYDGVTKKLEQECIDEKPIENTKKMDTLFSMIDEHPDEKAIIFSQFKGEMDYIQKNAQNPVYRIDGSVEKEERVRRLNNFKTAPNNSIMLIQVKCGGQGLNIQCASRIYFTAPAWNPSTELQAIGRSHRVGQLREVIVKKLVYKNTQKSKSVDQAMMALQGHKSFVCSEVLNDDSVKTQIPVKEISIDAIRNIFR